MTATYISYRAHWIIRQVPHNDLRMLLGKSSYLVRSRYSTLYEVTTAPKKIPNEFVSTVLVPLPVLKTNSNMLRDA